MKMERIGVFCGSSMGRSACYKEQAVLLGKVIAQSGLGLVYGGANIGLMKAIADSVMEHGGSVTGIMPIRLAQYEIVHQGIHEIILVDSMHERKAKIAELSDAFIAMPGGYGTLDEMAEILSWNQLDLIQKPLALFNINGFFHHLICYLDFCVEERFLRIEHRNNILVEDDPERLLQKLRSFKPLRPHNKWVDDLKMM
jgi:uncharacterized protein (TIGR00730 family)